MPIPVFAIFDIGKTNKKFFLFDETLREIKEEYIKLPLTADEDGYPCDDLEAIIHWIMETVKEICHSKAYELKGLNFSTYGATLVHLGQDGKPVTPLYNYLKPFPEALTEAFFAKNEEVRNNLETASPSLGMLNSGLQLYWLKHEKPDLFKKICHTLHFPQYLSYLFTNEMVCEPTSIGCHTRLWDYTKDSYHQWVLQEGFDRLFPAKVSSAHTFTRNLFGKTVKIGVGIHDSSSALASYLLRIKEPFLLISTGTWSISLNPFTQEKLTQEELERDCLNYLTIRGNPVKASRFFLGYELDHQLLRLNAIFHKKAKYYKTVPANPHLITHLAEGSIKSDYYPETIQTKPLIDDLFSKTDWKPEDCKDFEEAYHKVIWGLARLQAKTLQLAKGNSPIRKVFIDGGFVHNEVFIAMMRQLLKGYQLEFSDFPLGSAYGAATVMQEKIKDYPSHELSFD